MSAPAPAASILTTVRASRAEGAGPRPLPRPAPHAPDRPAARSTARSTARDASPDTPPDKPRSGPAREGHWARLFRRLADRQHLRDMEARLLRDVGLTRGEVRRGVPFRAAPQPRPAGPVRSGDFEARGCRLEPYAPAGEAAGLRPEGLAALAEDRA